MNTLNSAFYNKAWQEEREEASLCKKAKDTTKWQAFWDQYSKTYLEISKLLIPLNKELIKSWEKEGLIERSSRVLDIGCGPGPLALPLSERVSEVVALDTSEKMLAMLKEEAIERGIENLTYVQEDWRDLKGAEEYDLVLASNSPAIHNQKTLEKMNQFSRHYCLYICYATRVGSPLRSLLWKRILGEKIQGKTFSIKYPFNILYCEGYFPRITFVDQGYIHRQDIDEAFKNYQAYFRIFGREGQDVDNTIKKSISSMAHGGIVEEKIQYKLGIMWWSSIENKKRGEGVS